jgi:hypothetical protein
MKNITIHKKGAATFYQKGEKAIPRLSTWGCIPGGLSPEAQRMSVIILAVYVVLLP